MGTRNFTRVVFKVLKRLAWVLSWFVRPIHLFRWTGVLPFRVTSFLEFEPLHFHDQAAFNESKSLSYQGDILWTPPPTTNIVVSHVLEIQNGISTQGGYVFDETGRLIKEASHKYREQHQWGLVSRPYSLFSEIQNFNCQVGILTASNHQIYWHWLFEVLPRLGMIEKTGRSPDKFYVQKKYRFQRESLDLLEGISNETIIDCEQVQIISATKMIIPCLQISGNYPTWVCEYLRDRFTPHAIESCEYTRIYISRKNADHRRVINELEIIEILKRYDIVPVDLEDLSFTEQVNIFHHAELVVGPHGGGLANIVFCSKGTKVIELFPATTIDAFFALSRVLELDYYFLRARDGNSKNFSHDDYSVFPEDLVKTLEFAEVNSR